MATKDIIPVQYNNDTLILLDQTKLPEKEEYIEIKDVHAAADAIKKLVVRGAPAIGVAAGYGMCLAALRFFDKIECSSESQDGNAILSQDKIVSLNGAMKSAADELIESRPTAVNLKWAVNRIYNGFKNKFVISEDKDYDLNSKMRTISRNEVLSFIHKEADNICEEDKKNCRAIGENGLKLIKPGMTVITHCNAGILATAGYGTALAPLHIGMEKGYSYKAFVDETRPLLQGSRLTAWELMKAGIDVTLICDNMAATVMAKGLVDAVIVGCDRMAANGDAANKIGTSALAIIAKEYEIPFYVFLPSSTIDMNTMNGDDIVIEERSEEEIYRMWYKKDMAPKGVKAYNPAFDVTKNEYITAIVTDRGIARPPYSKSIRNLMEGEIVQS